MAGLEDTDPEAERVLVDLMRQATPGRRLALAFSLSRTVMGLSLRGLARRLPEADALELRLRFVELHYGSQLARELGAALRGSAA